MKILIWIPFYNCRMQLRRMLDDRLFDQVHDVDFCFIDNCSNDDSHLVLLDFIKRENQNFPNVRIYRNRQNLGLGGSFQLSVELASTHSHLVVFHGDYQASIDDLVRLIQSIKKEPAVDLWVGSRFHPDSQLMGYSFSRAWGNRVINQITSTFLGQSITEIGSGLMAYKLTQDFREVVSRLPTSIDYDFTLRIWMIHQQRLIKEFPISWRQFDQVTTVENDWQLGFHLIAQLLRVQWWGFEKLLVHQGESRQNQSEKIWPIQS